jgi:hypothetical protein
MSCKRHEKRAAERKEREAPAIKRRVDFYAERGYQPEAIARLIGVPQTEVAAHLAPPSQ